MKEMIRFNKTLLSLCFSVNTIKVVFYKVGPWMVQTKMIVIVKGWAL